MTNLLILCGGQSAEHEVSIMSARNVLAALDKNRFNPIIVGISFSGTWYRIDSLDNIIKIDDQKNPVTLIRKPHGTELYDGSKHIPIDVAFPVLHGQYGEDGSVQGLLKMYHVPFVGCDILSSAIGMDKEITKRLLKEVEIPVTPYMVFYEHAPINSDKIIEKLDLPFFVKPATQGSSIGVTKVKNKNEIHCAIQKAFNYSHKVLVEKYIKGREIECAVLDYKASVLGEIKPRHEFYSYEAKYIDPNGADLIIPAVLDPEIAARITLYSEQAFEVLQCKGMARVDFLLSMRGEIYLNEINTIPGFTNISMYPKLWEQSGVSYSQLITKLIDLAYRKQAMVV